jgi:hypothetical protein
MLKSFSAQDQRCIEDPFFTGYHIPELFRISHLWNQTGIDKRGHFYAPDSALNQAVDELYFLIGVYELLLVLNAVPEDNFMNVNFSWQAFYNISPFRDCVVILEIIIKLVISAKACIQTSAPRRRGTSPFITGFRVALRLHGMTKM